jgi:hypothetical protein
MPIIWMRFSTASTPEVHELRDDPVKLRDYVGDLCERAGATLEDLYFEVGAPRACALVRDLDDYVSAKAVAQILGVDTLTKLLNADQAARALQLAHDYRGGASSQSA